MPPEASVVEPEQRVTVPLRVNPSLSLAVEPGPPSPDVERLWYEVYVEELGTDHPCGDDVSRRLHDPFAAGGHLLVARDSDQRVAGTCLVLSDREVDLGFYRQLFDWDPAAGNVSVTTKMIVAPWARRSRLAFELAGAAYAYGLRVGIQTDYADCQPSRVPLFTRLGYRVLPGQSDHPYYGKSIRLRLDLNDSEHLEKVGSPLLRVRRQVL